MEIHIDPSDQFKVSEHLRQNRHLADRNAPVHLVMQGLLVLFAHVLFYAFAFGNDVRFYYRQVLYAAKRRLVYANRTPQLIRQDVARLAKVPNHVALILKVAPNERNASFEALLHHAVEGASWCVGTGSSQLTLYERTGVLHFVPLHSVAELLATGLASYFNEAPLITVRRGEESATAGSVTTREQGRPVLAITLASEDGGRPMMVRLAEQYALELAQGTLCEQDITVAKMDADMQKRVGAEPDLLVSFESNLDVAGFSPWLLRVTELFCLPDNNSVFHYMVFYAALEKFAKVKVNLGA